MKNKTKLTFFLLLFFLILPIAVLAEEEREVKYESDVIIDSDLDGLTDEGEKQLFFTEPLNPDTDADGITDGAEIISKINPLDPNEPKAREVILPEEKKETPWAWYVTRVAALMGFFLLYLSFIFGLAIRTPGLKNIISPANSFSIHGWISLQALIFAAIHGTSLLFDKFLNFSITDVFFPFVFNSGEAFSNLEISRSLMALGTLSFYIMLALVLTSYFRKYISQGVWRSIHFLNIGLYILVIIHAYYLGTDLQAGWPRYIFIGANALLGLLIIFSLINKLISFLRSRKEIKNENLYPSNTEVI